MVYELIALPEPTSLVGSTLNGSYVVTSRGSRASIFGMLNDSCLLTKMDVTTEQGASFLYFTVYLLSALSPLTFL